MLSTSFHTQNGYRPDLAKIGSLSQQDLGGYAFHKIFPMLNVGEKSGKMSVAKADLTPAQAQKNRVNGASLDQTVIDKSLIEWTTNRYEGRGIIYADDGASYTSEAEADKAGALQSTRMILNSLEQDAFNLYFNSGSNGSAKSLPVDGVVETLQGAAHDTRAFGNPYLTMTVSAFRKFCNIPEIAAYAKEFARVSGDIGYLALKNEKVREVIVGLIAFDGIILFDDKIVVNSKATNEAFGNKLCAVVGLRSELFGTPDQANHAVRDIGVQGFGQIYLPKGASGDSPFEFSCSYDSIGKRNLYDSEVFAGFKIVDPKGHKVFKFLDSYKPAPASDPGK